MQFVYQNMAFLPWIGNLQESEKLGLLNGSLYDTLESFTPEGMPTQVNGVGFNVSCSYLRGENTKVNLTAHATWENTWGIVLPSVNSQEFWLYPSGNSLQSSRNQDSSGCRPQCHPIPSGTVDQQHHSIHNEPSSGF
jgi:hypothetical protein